MPEDFDRMEVDLVLANILAGPLVSLAGELTACLKLGGQLVLSGILESQREQVSSAYADALGAPAVDQKEDWLRLVFQSAGGAP
ncbi:MAG: 50S ribosomal protein L11 methyltransferase, partial [Pseudomonadota bacterium]